MSLEASPRSLTHGVNPDPFQIEAIEHLVAGRSVVVCAPTGSGKTLVADAAAAIALEQGERLYYTTPLKALSNQKFRDFGALFGPERCGLLTGDVSIRPTAPVVVMTTEVLRNMLIQRGPQSRLSGVRFVVLDECHYIGKYGRGTVWEESILCCPSPVQLLALSATIANPAQIADWMDSVHPETVLVEDKIRPVPLRFYYYRDGDLSPLNGKPSGRGARKGTAARTGRSFSGARDRSPYPPGGWEDLADPGDVVETLADLDMLPAIYFVFSRRGCEVAMKSCAHLTLVNRDEGVALQEQIEHWLDVYPSLAAYPYLPELRAGIAAHHAGLLPAWKVVIERLYQQRLIKVVFATETLAAGINMPARSTIISSLQRRGENGYRSLTPTEFHQMSGRAGRRGMDKWGSVITLAESRTPRSVIETLVGASPEPLGSCLSPGYSLVLNWLPEYGEDRSRRLIEHGLGSFIAARYAPRGAVPAWKQFVAAREVLDHYHLLDGCRPTQDGMVVAALRTENELLTARILLKAVPASPDPALLAGALGAVAGAGVGRGIPPLATGRVRKPHRGLQPILAAAAELSKELRRVQREHRFACPTTISPSFSILVDRWARGCSWDEILDATDLDEGDIVYAMRSTIDLLEQVRSSPVEQDLRDRAAAAAAQLDRSPVSEVL